MTNIFTGKFTRTSAENYEEVMTALGVNWMLRKAALMSTPVMEITESPEGDWNIKTSTIAKTMEMKFRLGEEFEEVAVDGRKCLTTVTKEGDNTIIINQKDTGPAKLDVKSVREYDLDGIKQTITVGDVKAFQTWKRD